MYAVRARDIEMPSEPFDYFEKHEYDQGICECYKDPLVCIVGWFIPCCLVGKVAADLDGNGKSFDCVSCLCAHIGLYRNRKLVHARDQIHESERGSILAASLCPLCAICQDAHQAGLRLEAPPAPAPQTEAPVPVAPPQQPEP